jgi:hypothetical protein
MQLSLIDNIATMSSREIAELVDQRHDNVKRTIETIGARGVLILPQIEEVPNPGHGPKTISVYMLDKRSSLIVVAQLCPEFTARIVDRWQELEQAAELPRSTQAKPQAIPATKVFTDFFRVARLIGLDKNVAAISSNQATTKLTGMNVLQLLGQTHLIAEKQELIFTPTELGAQFLGGISANKTNLLLEKAGLQQKTGKHWTPMPAAEGLYRLLDTGKKHGDGTSVVQIKWFERVAKNLAGN